MLPWLFDSSVFSPRWACGPGWTQLLQGATMIGDAGMALMYTLLLPPMIVLYLWVVGHRSPFHRVLKWATAFIFLCGVSHVTELMAFYSPAYRLFAAVKLAGAAVSVAATVVAIRDLGIAAKWVMRMRGATTDDAILDALRNLIREYREAHKPHAAESR